MNNQAHYYPNPRQPIGYINELLKFIGYIESNYTLGILLICTAQCTHKRIKQPVMWFTDIIK